MRFNQDYAFTAGLLHDIGRLVLVSCFPQQYERVIGYRAAHDCFPLEAERAVLGIDHVAAGVALAEHWNFSDTMKLAIANHHDPDTPGAGFLSAIIHIATRWYMRSIWRRWRTAWCRPCRPWPGRRWDSMKKSICNCSARRNCNTTKSRWCCCPDSPRWASAGLVQLRRGSMARSRPCQ